jgi:hypothetical protein
LFFQVEREKKLDSTTTKKNRKKEMLTIQVGGQSLPEKDTEVGDDLAPNLILSGESVCYSSVARVTMMHLRDTGTDEIYTEYQGIRGEICNQSDKGACSLIPTPDHALAPEEWKIQKNKIATVNLPLERYYQLESQVNKIQSTLDQLELQWTSLPPHKERLPLDVKKPFQRMRTANQDAMKLVKITTEKQWKLSMDVIEAYRLLVRDTVKGFHQESQQMLGVYQQVRKEIQALIQESENTGFFQTFSSLYRDFQFFIESIRGLLPTPIQFHQHIDQQMSRTSHQQDPCCVKRTGHLREQLERIESALSLHRDTQKQRQIASTSLSSELEMVTQEWTVTQQELEKLKDQLLLLDSKKTSLWTKEASVPELQDITTQQEQLRSKQTRLLEKIQPLRASMERLRTQNVSVMQWNQMDSALQQIVTWKHRISEFEKQCCQESTHWMTGRGVQYKALESVRDETLSTLHTLYLMCQQKIDESGLALVRYALNIKRDYLLVAKESLSSIENQHQVAKDTITSYIQRVTPLEPQLAELWNKHLTSELRLEELRSSITEIQLKQIIQTIVQAQLSVL